MYEGRFPNRNISDAQTFSNIHRLCERGSFKSGNHLKRAQHTIRTPEIEVEVLNVIERDQT